MHNKIKNSSAIPSVTFRGEHHTVPMRLLLKKKNTKISDLPESNQRPKDLLSQTTVFRSTN
ncbi:unnamed protein product [Brassica oleracea]